MESSPIFIYIYIYIHINFYWSYFLCRIASIKTHGALRAKDLGLGNRSCTHRWCKTKEVVLDHQKPMVFLGSSKKLPAFPTRCTKDWWIIQIYIYIYVYCILYIVYCILYVHIYIYIYIMYGYSPVKSCSVSHGNHRSCHRFTSPSNVRVLRGTGRLSLELDETIPIVDVPSGKQPHSYWKWP